MTKQEFLRELEFALLDSLPADDATEILADYTDIFENGIADGKNEQQIAAELGSPAKIARTILNDLNKERPEPQVTYVYAQENPDPPENLASMSRRLGAYFIDSLLFGGVFLLLVCIISFSLFAINTTSGSVQISDVQIVDNGQISDDGRILNSAADFESVQNSQGMHNLSESGSTRYASFLIAFAPLFVMSMAVLIMLASTFFIWLTNGYTPGKWLLKIRIVKIDGSKMSFGTAFLREALMKIFVNALTSSVLNVGSFIWGCCTPEHKTVHDLAANTAVIIVPRVKGE